MCPTLFEVKILIIFMFYSKPNNNNKSEEKYFNSSGNSDYSTLDIALLKVIAILCMPLSYLHIFGENYQTLTCISITHRN